VFLHEWRGSGSSNLRADAGHDWGYRELLERDVPASEAAIAAALPEAARIVGGHSLGAQIGLLRLALAPEAASEAWLVGSGSPYWRAFPLPQRLLLPLAYRFVPWLAQRHGYLPGRRIGFGGNEARGLIVDWAATAMRGRYAAAGIATDLEAALAQIETKIRAILLADDWMAPASSLRFLLSKLQGADADVSTLGRERLGAPADHFAWMKAPDAVADVLCSAD
jgi:predicted alpha/beta hydrolase